MRITAPLAAATLATLAACSSTQTASSNDPGITVNASTRPAAHNTTTDAALVADRALTTGDTAPNFNLKNANGNFVSLNSLLDDGPVVLTWYRGGWCPYCNESLAEFARYNQSFQNAGATLVAISPETPDNAKDTKANNELDFTVLSDTQNNAAQDFNLVFRLNDQTKSRYKNYGIDLAKANNDDSWTLPLAATYIITPDRKIAWAFIDPDYTERPDPADVLKALNNL